MSRTLEEKTYRNNLLHLRNSVMFVLAFMSFLRSPESSLICTKNMKSSEGFISSFIEKSKAIQLREGQSVVATESGSSMYPVALLKLYLNSCQLSFDSDDFLGLFLLRVIVSV